MALYKSSEFAAECGVSVDVLYVMIGRQKVIRNENKLIDSSHPTNALYLQKCKAKKKETPPAEVVTTQGKPDPVKVERDAELKELMAMEKETKRLAMESKRKEQAIMDAKLAKMHGQLMPTDLVKILFAQHFREVSTSFKQGIDGILSEIGKKARLNGNQVAEIRATMVKIINECVNKSVDNSKKSVERVVNEYQTAKNSA